MLIFFVRSEKFSISDISGTRLPPFAMVTSAENVSSKVSFVDNDHKSSRINREPVASSSGTTHNVEVTPSGQTASKSTTVGLHHSTVCIIVQLSVLFIFRRVLVDCSTSMVTLSIGFL